MLVPERRSCLPSTQPSGLFGRVAQNRITSTANSFVLCTRSLLLVTVFPFAFRLSTFAFIHATARASCGSGSQSHPRRSLCVLQPTLLRHAALGSPARSR